MFKKTSIHTSRNLSSSLLKLHFRRFELKYSLSTSQYLFLRSLISQRLKLDPFAAKEKAYLVESIYFDTPHLTAFYQTDAGIKNRIKYRLRTYKDNFQTNSRHIFWEIKRKRDMTVYKDRSLVTKLQSVKLLNRACKLPVKDQTLTSFNYAINRYLLKPKVLIRYRREPYLSQNRNLRITFDTNIQACPIRNLTEQPTSFITMLGLKVMELKFTGSLPFWLAQLVRQNDLQRQPFSKYCLCLSQVKSALL